MSCGSSVIRFIRTNCARASISVETAIILPFVFLFFFVFLSFFQYMAAYLNVSQAADLTARYMSYYACAYYEEGVEKINTAIADKVYDAFGEKDMSSLKFMEDAGSNISCIMIADSIFDMFIKKNDHPLNKCYKIENISLAGSSFFKQDNSFELKICCTVDTFFPLPDFFGEGYLIDVCIKGNGWTGGAYFAIESEPSIWELNNFDRGKAIETYLGANLPDDYPVIDIYDKSSGAITLIKSIDHTASSYVKISQFKKVLDDCFAQITGFNGSEYLINGEYKITGKDIKKRKIVLVVPTNDMTKAQIAEIMEFSAKCGASGVDFILERYHVSY